MGVKSGNRGSHPQPAGCLSSPPWPNSMTRRGHSTVANPDFCDHLQTLPTLPPQSAPSPKSDFFPTQSLLRPSGVCGFLLMTFWSQLLACAHVSCPLDIFLTLFCVPSCRKCAYTGPSCCSACPQWVWWGSFCNNQSEWSWAF